jgi:DNA-binding NarL/FixJ family response regulator
VAIPEQTKAAASSPAPVTDAPWVQTLGGSALDPRVQPQCSLAVQLRRAAGSVVGRTSELAAIGQELREAESRLSALTIEGEPGVGKTRLLLAAAEMATQNGFTVAAVAADEEIRGPFLLAQSIFAAPALREVSAGTEAESAIARVMEALSGHDEPGLGSLGSDAKLLRTFDLAGVALSEIAETTPLALLIDDAQWADDDTLRLLRYAVRADADRPIFLLLTIRPDEFAEVTEAVNLIADMERMGLVRRLRPGRFSQAETAELAGQVLGGVIDPASAAAMHSQSEGLPFIVEELAKTYREAGMIQRIDGVWTLGRNAARLVPSAVRTLIGRRAAHLPEETRSVLADAAVLGRSFSLRDLREIRSRLDGAPPPAGSLADALEPAVRAGLLLQHAEGRPADYTFTHEQVRDYAMGELVPSRLRAVHRTIVELLLESGDPSPAALPLIAQHALAGGDAQHAAQLSVDAARAALGSNAPEEALRLIEQALPNVSTSQDRRNLLVARDDAYASLRNTVDRLEGLAELAALVEALGDSGLELDVQLRRAAALRFSKDEDGAAELARRVRARAAELGDTGTELRACLELGQALYRSSLGESFGAAGKEVDLDGAEEAFRAAIALAERLGDDRTPGDDRSLAAALREVGTILVSRVRAWFTSQVLSGEVAELTQRVIGGEPVDEVLASSPVAPLVAELRQIFERALGLYERLDDRSGVMSTVIAMAYINYAPMIHINASARHIEEIRRVTGRLTALVTESERQKQELQMVYGVHVYARAKVVPDLMISRGVEAHRLARLVGDRSAEFLAAGGVALAHLDMGEQQQAEEWLDRAATAAAASPTSLRARQLETWRGLVRASAGDVTGMREHMDRAVQMATDSGRPAARCESLAELSLAAARLGAGKADDELLELAERCATEAIRICGTLPGHPPWGAKGDAALAVVHSARGDLQRAAASGEAAIHALQAGLHEDANLDILLPAARAVLAGGPPELQATVRGFLQLTLSRIAQGVVDDDIRVRWLRGPVGRELVELAGPIEVPGQAAAVQAPAPASGAEPADGDRRLLELLTHGSSNREIASELHIDEAEVTRRLARLVAALGASSRAEATSLAFRSLAS